MFEIAKDVFAFIGFATVCCGVLIAAGMVASGMARQTRQEIFPAPCGMPRRQAALGAMANPEEPLTEDELAVLKLISKNPGK